MSGRTQDPFDLLREQLVEAAAPEGAGAGARGRRRAAWRRRLGGRPLVAVAAALALGGTATAAAVVALGGGDPSPPLRGPVPEAAARDYAIGLRPDLRAGAAGWCATVRLRDRQHATGASSGCGPALEAAYPQIAGGVTTVGPTRVLDFRIVDARVAAVRLGDGRRIVPRADPALPSGWRATVAFVKTARGRIDPRMLDVTLLGADGRAVAGPRSPRGVPPLPVAKVDPRHPPARPCAIEHRALAHLSAREQRVVTGPLTPRDGTFDAAGRPLRTCAAALFSLDGVRLRAAVLVDARDPAGAAPALPGGSDASDAAARRIAGGRAWLVVDGGTPSVRGRLLDALSAHPPTW